MLRKPFRHQGFRLKKSPAGLIRREIFVEVGLRFRPYFLIMSEQQVSAPSALASSDWSTRIGWMPASSSR